MGPVGERRICILLDSFDRALAKRGSGLARSRDTSARVPARGIVMTKLCSYRCGCSDRVEFVIDCRCRNDGDENGRAIKFAA
jgi:hypothetical protein